MKDVDLSLMTGRKLTREQISKGVKMDLNLAFEVIAVACSDQRVHDVIVQVFWERYEKMLAEKEAAESEVKNG